MFTLQQCASWSGYPDFKVVPSPIWCWKSWISQKRYETHSFNGILNNTRPYSTVLKWLSEIRSIARSLCKTATAELLVLRHSVKYKSKLMFYYVTDAHKIKHYFTLLSQVSLYSVSQNKLWQTSGQLPPTVKRQRRSRVWRFIWHIDLNGL